MQWDKADSAASLSGMIAHLCARAANINYNESIKHALNMYKICYT